MVPGPLDSRFYRFLHRVLPPLLGRFFRMSVAGQEHIPARGPVVLASNHHSNLDPFFLGVSCPRQIHFMAKAEIWRVPLVGRLVTMLGSFPVHRGGADRQAVKQALRILQQGGLLGIFPEGRRQPEDAFGEPQPGVGLFALREGVVTIPVALRGTGRVFQGGRPHLPRVSVTFGPPVVADLGVVSRSERHHLMAGHLMSSIARLQGVELPAAAVSEGGST